MKKLSAIVLAICFVLGSLGSAAAIDVKVKGNWHFSYGYYGNQSLYDVDGADDMDAFQARMRTRTVIEFIASETLSAMLHFEIGVGNYGQAGGFQLNTDGNNVKTKWMALDWTIPQTKTHIRMGLHRVALPSAVFGDNFVFVADAAGIAINQEITPEVGITAFWARPYDTSVTGTEKHFSNDEMDLFALMVPVKTDIIRVTPWAMVGFIGENSGYNAPADGANRLSIYQGRWVPTAARKGSSMAWWAGLSLELPIVDPFIAKFEGMYGHQSNGTLGDTDFSQRGYFLAAQFGYKFDWGQASVIGWYGSGDNNEADDRYGTIPVVSVDGGFALGVPAFAGNRYLQRTSIVNETGAGTWGLGFAFDNMSFIPNLTHGLRAFYFKGTNSADRIQGSTYLYTFDSWSPNHDSYMVSTDWGVSAMWTNTYKFNDNFHMGLDLGWTHLDLSHQRGSEQRDTSDQYMGVVSFGYSF